MISLFLDYGDRKNSDLADRFSVPSDDKDKFPFVKLFVKNKADEPIDFVDSNFNVESLKRFVKKNSGKMTASSFKLCLRVSLL